MAVTKVGGQYGNILFLNGMSDAEKHLAQTWNASDRNGRIAIERWLRAQDNNRRGIR